MGFFINIFPLKLTWVKKQIKANLKLFLEFFFFFFKARIQSYRESSKFHI